MKQSLAIFCGLSAAQLCAEPSVSQLPKKVVPTPPITDDVTVKERNVETSIQKGVRFLVETQNPNGSWGSARKTKELNIYAPIPGAHHAFQVGTSCLALTGLLASGDSSPEALGAIDKCDAWLVDFLPRLRRSDDTAIYNNWGHAYSLRALAALSQRDGVSAEKKAQYAKLAQTQIDSLWRNQDLDGGWGYYGRGSVTAQPSGQSMSFTTATVLLAIKEASGVFDLKLDERRIKIAIASIQRQRTPDFAYVYSMSHRNSPRYRINRPAGSLARTPACSAALKLWGDEKITEDVLELGLDRLIKRNGWLDIGRKRPKPHETHFAISGYFYYYGHYYASECITLLPKEKQGQWKTKLAAVMLDKQESDGSWWDYPLYNYGQAYGTGYALTVMARCRK